MSRYTKLTKLYLNLKSLMNCFLRLRLYFVFTVYKVFNKYFFFDFQIHFHDSKASHNIFDRNIKSHEHGDSSHIPSDSHNFIISF